MKFRNECRDEFLSIFKENKPKIAGFNNCLGVELLQDIADPDTFFTYSKWESENDLDLYRQSELFIHVWSQTKKLFSAKAEAWSLARKQ